MWRPTDERHAVVPLLGGEKNRDERRLLTTRPNIEHSTESGRGSPDSDKLANAASTLQETNRAGERALPRQQGGDMGLARGEAGHLNSSAASLRGIVARQHEDNHARLYPHQDQQRQPAGIAVSHGSMQQRQWSRPGFPDRPTGTVVPAAMVHSPIQSMLAGGAGSLADGRSIGSSLDRDAQRRRQLQVQHQQRQHNLHHQRHEGISTSPSLLPSTAAMMPLIGKRPRSSNDGTNGNSTTSSLPPPTGGASTLPFPARSSENEHPPVAGFEVPPSLSEHRRPQQSRISGGAVPTGINTTRSTFGGRAYHDGDGIPSESTAAGISGLFSSSYGSGGDQWVGLGPNSSETMGGGARVGGSGEASMGGQSPRPRLPPVSRLLGNVYSGQQQAYGAATGQESQSGAGSPTSGNSVKDEQFLVSHHQAQRTQLQQQQQQQHSISSGWSGMGAGALRGAGGLSNASAGMNPRLSSGLLSSAGVPMSAPSLSQQQMHLSNIGGGGGSGSAILEAYPAGLRAIGGAMHPPQTIAYNNYSTTSLSGLQAATLTSGLGARSIGQAAGTIYSGLSNVSSRKRPRSASPGSNKSGSAAGMESGRGSGREEELNLWQQQQGAPAGDRVQSPRLRRLGACSVEGCGEPAMVPTRNDVLSTGRYCYHHAGLGHPPSPSVHPSSISASLPLPPNTPPSLLTSPSQSPQQDRHHQQQRPADRQRHQSQLCHHDHAISSNVSATGDGASSGGAFSTGSIGSPTSRDSEDIATTSGEGVGFLLPSGSPARGGGGSGESTTGRRGAGASGVRGGRGGAVGGGAGGIGSTGARGGGRCEVAGCSTQPRYAANGATRPRFCGSHKLPGQMNVVSRCCKHPSCSKVPHFGNDRERPLYCAEHKLQGMVNVANRRCEDPECQRQPTYGNKGDKRPRFCSTHKHPGMHDVIARRCEAEGCMTRAAFNFHGQKAVRFCAAHKLEGMENLKSKCCEVPGCKKYRVYGFDGEPAVCCASHKRVGMVDVRSSRCEFAECFRHPSFGYKWEKKRRFCGRHKLANMIDVRSRNQPQKGAGGNKSKAQTASSSLPPRQRVPGKAPELDSSITPTTRPALNAGPEPQGESFLSHVGPRPHGSSLGLWAHPRGDSRRYVDGDDKAQQDAGAMSSAAQEHGAAMGGEGVSEGSGDRDEGVVRRR